MPLIRRLFGLWVIGKTVSSTTTLFTRLLMSMAAIAILAAFAAVLMLALMGGALWLGYEQMLAHGMDAQTAMLVLGGIILALLGTTGLYTQHHFRRMRDISRHLIHARSPVSNKVSHIADAFMDGLLSEPPHNKTY